MNSNNFWALFNHSSDIIFALSADHKFKAVNPVFENILGCQKKAVLNHYLSDFIPQNKTESLNEIFQELLRNDEINELTLEFIVQGHDRYELKGCAFFNRIDKEFYFLLKKTHLPQTSYPIGAFSEELIRQLPNPFFLFNQSGKFLLWNEAFEKVTGYTPEEINSLPLLNLFPPSYQLLIQEHIQIALEKGETTLNAPVLSKKGEKIPYSFTAASIHYYGEACVFGTGLDISEHHNLLQERSLLINNTDEAFLLIDDQLKIVTYNHRMEFHYHQLYGSPIEKGATFRSLPLPGHSEALKKIVENVFKGKPQIARFAIPENEGGEKIFELRFKPIKSDAINGIFLTTTDITAEHQANKALKESEKALKDSNERFELIMQAGSECIWDFNPLTNELFLGDGYRRMFGLEPQTLQENKSLNDSFIHPDDRDAFIQSLDNVLNNPQINSWEGTYRFRKKDGAYAHVKDKAIILRDKKGNPTRMLGAMQDISTQYFHTQLEELEKIVMEQSMATNIEIREVLETYIHGLQLLFPGMKASIMEIRESKLQNLISPSLPKAYIEAISGEEIGPNGGSCGTAAFLKQKVIVVDIQNDERWSNYKELALKYQLGACWSQPIFNIEGEVIATIANYYSEPRTPTEKEEHCIERAQRLISIIFQKFSYLEKIQQSNERNDIINKATNDAIYDWDVKKDIFYWGDGFQKILGFQPHKENFKIKDWVELTHPIDRERNKIKWETFLADPDRNKWQKEFQFRRNDGSYAYVEEIGYLVRDKAGKPKRMIGALRDRSKEKLDTLQKQINADVALLFKLEGALDTILPKVLSYLARIGEFSMAEIWLKSQIDNELKLYAKYAANKKAEMFYRNVKDLVSLDVNEGLPGHVFNNKATTILDQLESNKTFARKIAVKNTGLNSAIGVPLFHNNDIIGTLVLASELSAKKLEIFRRVFSSLENNLGAEIKRKQQEEELHAFFEYAPDIIAIATTDGYFAKVNPAFCKLLGYSAEELTSQPFSNFLHPNDLDGTINEYIETITGARRVNNFINRYSTKSGAYVWISWNSSSAFGEDNYVFAYGRDVTALLEIQESLENATKLARVGSWEVDLINDVTFWSSMTRKIHEVPEDFKINMELAMNFYRADIRDQVNSIVSEAMESGKSFDFEMPIITAKGRERWIRSIGNVELVEGKCVRIFGSFQDIHERKVIELRLKNISNNVPGVLFQYHLRPDGSDELNFVSEGSKEVWGFTPEECIADIDNVWGGIKQGGEVEMVRQSIMESAKNLTRWRARWRYVKPDGAICFHEGFGNPYKMADDTIVWDSIITDITDLHELERLAERTSKIARIGSWELDLKQKDQQEMYWSLMTRQILDVDEKYNPSYTGGLEFCTSKSRKILRKAVDKIIATGEEFDLELLTKTAGGNSRWVRCIGNSERVGGKCTKIFGSIQDIHLQKSAEEQILKSNLVLEKHAKELAHSNAELEQFAYVASHDLQEPLRMVTGFLTQLEKKYGDQLDDKALQYIDFAVDGAKRMRQIILDLLDFSRAGRYEGKLESVNIKEIIEEVNQLQRKVIEEKKATIYFDKLPTIDGHRPPLLQVFHNLIGNALKYSEATVAPEINIKAKKLPAYWQFSVADNGIGIDPEYYDKIFVIFQRLHNKNEYGGTGMGLSIVKKIIENMGGKIWVESRRGKGSTFYFTVPKLIQP
ncbi:PAS domain S-box protein [Marivirga sp. S37H4]|uniref:histidine kinase n=1 Tax=Marivirga aurantiaca TaxID=2802615 RepID=A0A935C8R1_9BACT|nr:PAS domain S-box protein [Marivirga aurantiaca]MBK6265751.1 PAS domain S-box protein [Marivirga aurantiaca]